MRRWRVVVVASFADEFVVDADDERDARDAALDQAYDEQPFADEYEVFEVLPEDEPA